MKRRSFLGVMAGLPLAKGMLTQEDWPRGEPPTDASEAACDCCCDPIPSEIEVTIVDGSAFPCTYKVTLPFRFDGETMYARYARTDWCDKEGD